MPSKSHVLPPILLLDLCPPKSQALSVNALQHLMLSPSSSSNFVSGSSPLVSNLQDRHSVIWTAPFLLTNIFRHLDTTPPVVQLVILTWRNICGYYIKVIGFLAALALDEELFFFTNQINPSTVFSSFLNDNLSLCNWIKSFPFHKSKKCFHWNFQV